MKKVYLDYAATTPVDEEVLKAMLPFFNKKFGNAGSTHWFGQEASAAIFMARKKIADSIGADYKEIVFTGSATEANNLALRGIAMAGNRPKIITTVVEHDSVYETCENLKENGVEIVYLPVDEEGFINLKKLEKELDERTLLVSVVYANSEIGVIQDIFEIARIIKEFKEKSAALLSDRPKSPHSKPLPIFPLFHIDAVQAFQFLSCSVDELGIDLMSMSAHKIYGPKGIGALYARNGNPEAGRQSDWLKPIITGGGQEFGLRSGTENVPYIAGFGKAIELALKQRNKEVKRQKELRDYLWRELKRIVPEAELNGPKIAAKTSSFNNGNFNRLPNNLNIYFPGRPAQDLAIELDLWGVAVSPGTACSTRMSKPSRVIAALEKNNDRPYSSIRLTLGRQTTKQEINNVLGIFKNRFAR